MQNFRTKSSTPRPQCPPSRSPNPPHSPPPPLPPQLSNPPLTQLSAPRKPPLLSPHQSPLPTPPSSPQSSPPSSPQSSPPHHRTTCKARRSARVLAQRLAKVLTLAVATLQIPPLISARWEPRCANARAPPPPPVPPQVAKVAPSHKTYSVHRYARLRRCIARQTHPRPPLPQRRVIAASTSLASTSAGSPALRQGTLACAPLAPTNALATVQGTCLA